MLKPIQEFFENNSCDVSFATGLENSWSKLKWEISGNLQERLLEREWSGLQEMYNVITEQSYNKIEVYLSVWSI